MARLPRSLSIALWAIAAIWVVAILAHVFDAPREIVYLTFLFGLFTAVAEWLSVGRSHH